MLGVSEGFVSLVKSRERSLTIDHLELVADALSVPLGALLIAATDPPAAAPDQRKLFEISSQILKKADVARHKILRGVLSRG
jgi:hypothetical protein